MAGILGSCQHAVVIGSASDANHDRHLVLYFERDDNDVGGMDNEEGTIEHDAAERAQHKTVGLCAVDEDGRAVPVWPGGQGASAANIVWVTINEFEDNIGALDVHAPFRAANDREGSEPHRRVVDWSKVSRLVRMVHDTCESEPERTIADWRQNIREGLGFDEPTPPAWVEDDEDGWFHIASPP